MRITTKITILTTTWMLCIMILINLVVYFSFMKITINLEENSQFQKARDLVNDIDIDTSHSSSRLNKVLKGSLTQHSYIRILQSKNKTIHEVTNDPLLTKKIKGKYVGTKHAQTQLISSEQGEEEVLIVRVLLNGKFSRILEVGGRLPELEVRKEILRVILAISIISAVIPSLLGGGCLANTIIRPISNMIHTMEEIEKGGVPKTITIRSKRKDELETMARTFNRMIQRLQENFEKQKQFVSDASHELKTPLTVILSYANFLRRHGTENKEMTKEAIEAIHSESTKIQKMTETFLELANLEKEDDLELNEVNLLSLCQSILKQLKDVYKRELIFHYEKNSFIIRADEIKIKQVIIILLDNAMKYSNEKIDVFLEKNKSSAIIRVKDYGIGIPQEEINNIFERFYRVDKARSRETGGAGLGLNIAKSIMKLHKGEIKVTSNEGVGTESVLIFPL